jgi:predicted dehydrogenase
MTTAGGAVEPPRSSEKPTPSGGGSSVESLRVGILGAARIAELAIVKPAHATGTRLVTVAARDRRRAEAFAAEHGVERAVGSYAEVLADPEVEVVYNPLPNALHGPWNLAAVEAGKHVLSEKPFASTAEEAVEVRDAADQAGVTVVEGFHYLFHPVMQRLSALLDSGELGELRRVDAFIAMPEPDDGDPRWSFDLAGGALMDLGCYGLHANRHLGRWAGGEPALIGARAKERDRAPGVDEWLEADLRFPSGATGAVRCSMVHPRFEMTLRVEGARGEATVMDFVQPHKDDRVVIRTETGESIERLGTRSSYIYQLEELITALRDGAPMSTGPDDAVATAQLIDACYGAAGLPLRRRTTLTPTDPRS